MTEIKCIVDDCGNEYLPDFTETELWAGKDICNLTKREGQLVMLYNSIVKAENYWYNNTPTAFGNPDYSMYVGTVNGMIAGLGWDYQDKDGWIVIKTGKRTIMKIQKPKKTKAYLDAVRDNCEILKTYGL